MKPIYNLKDWTIESIPGTHNYWLIGFRYFQLVPDVTPQYEFIHTSELVSITFNKECIEKEVRAETKNGIYILDQIDRLYTATYVKNAITVFGSSEQEMGKQKINIVDDKPDEEGEDDESEKNDTNNIYR